MNVRYELMTVLSAALLAGASFLAAPSAASPADGQVLPRGEGRVEQRFAEAWRGFFGSEPVAPAPSSGGGENGDLQVFQSLWEANAELLPHPGRKAALMALRAKALSDPAPALDALHGIVSRGRFHPLDMSGPLLYQFLDEAVADPTMAPQVLPPDPQRIKLRRAVGNRGSSWPDFEARFQAWGLLQAARAGLISPERLDPPCVWALDRGLGAGAFAAVSFEPSQEEGLLSLEAAGGFDSSLHLLAIKISETGWTHSASLAPLPDGVFRLPRHAGQGLLLLVLNPGADRAALGGLALTVWQSPGPLFEVEAANLEGNVFSLLLKETDGVAGYSLFGLPRSGPALPLTAGGFPSEGEGRHLYRIALPASAEPPRLYRLLGLTAAGGEYAVEFSAEPEEGDRAAP